MLPWTVLTQQGVTIGMLSCGTITISVLLVAVISTKTIQRNGRILMSLSCLALILAQIAGIIVHLLKILEFNIEESKQKEIRRLLLIIHVSGRNYASVLFVAMAVDQYLSATFRSWPNQKTSFRTTVVASVLSIPYAIYSAVLNFYYDIDSLTHSVNIATNGAATLLLVIAWRKSAKKYKEQFGQATLTERYQLFETSNWSSTVMPAAILSTVMKSMGTATIILMPTFQGVTKNTVLFAYYLADAAQTFLLGIIVIYYNQRIRRKCLAYLSKFCCVGVQEAQVHPGVLDNGNQNDYFNMLHSQWQ